MSKYKKVNNYILGGLFILALLLGIFLIVRSIKEKQEIRKKAAVPGGVATFSLDPQTATIERGQELDVKIKFQSPTTPNDKGIEGILAVLNYTFSADNPLALTAENIEFNLPSPWALDRKEVIPEGNKIIIRIFSHYGSEGGYLDTLTPKEFATLKFTAQNEGDINLSFVSSESKIYAKEEGAEDILSSDLPTGIYHVSSVTSPTPSPSPTPTAVPLGGACTNNENCQGFDASVGMCVSQGKILCLANECLKGYCDIGECQEVSGTDTETHTCQPGLHYNLPSGNELCCPAASMDCAAYCSSLTPAAPMPTITPTPIPTTPPEGKVKITLKIRFSGIAKSRPDDPPLDKPPQSIRLKIVKDGRVLQELGFDNPKTLLSSDGEGVYSKIITLSPEVTAGSNYAFFVKGPKHLQTKYCLSSGQTRPCNSPNITLIEGENILDFTQFPLMAGDLPLPGGQDGVIDAKDAVFIDTCIREGKIKDPTCVAIGDLDLSGNISGADMNLLNLNALNRWEDEIGL